jgi:DNA-binding Lrp family transcriptional regulator
MELDETDRRLVALLRQDSRMSNVEIGRAVGLTEGAVRSRIKRMRDGGVIMRFTIELSEGSGGSYAVVMVKAKGTTKRMMGEIASLALHKDAYEISGEYDGCVIIHGESMEDLDSRIDRIRNLPSVADTRTYVSFRRW